MKSHVKMGTETGVMLPQTKDTRGHQREHGPANILISDSGPLEL